MVLSNEFSHITPLVPSSSALKVKIYSSSGVKPRCNLASSLERYLFEKYLSLIIAVLAAFFVEATEISNSLILLEEESDEEESSSTLSFSLAAIILASVDSFLLELLTSH